MIKLSVKSVTGLFLVSGFTVAGLYGVVNMNREVTPYEINSQPAFHYNQNELVESLDALVNDSNATAENTEVAKTKVADAKNAQEKTEAATQKFKKAEEAKNSALNEAKNAEETVKKVSVAKKEAEEEVKKAMNAEEKAKAEAKVKALEEEAKKAEEARIAAQEKARLAEEEARIAEEAKKAAEEEKQRKEAEAKQAIEEAIKKIEETSKQEPAEKTPELPKQETTKQPEEKVTNTNSTNSTPSAVESPSVDTNDLEIVKNAVERTRNAKSLTVKDERDNSTKLFDTSVGTELITKGIEKLYSYKMNQTKTVSLLKEDENSKWKMVFSGYKSSGVIELELLKNIESVQKNNDKYNVTVSSSNAKKWLSTYYGGTSVDKAVTITVGISNNYVNYIEGTVGAESFKLKLTNANTTVIPTRESLGIDENTIRSLEEEYKAKQDCEREGDHWVCGPHKHVNQYKF